ncbi:GNAT superfamily N-acetyltransferase [Catenuloplanes nepalensis]|uniref:GNAT superfamily N-acetyltransferase n=1 Tax=Catenuloplanes nepalensis TaxID=587533 RepID=A0ABT9N6K0_9ACTN|nr:GNAT family N-acetyltransferase [Catenuloplanes nepalensis]MDP9799327.1 GNAT superfamily N-acetyltransferase [Catenuloplanes nepalensis]
MPDVSYDRLDGPAAAALAGQLAEVYAEVYAEPPYLEGPEHLARFREHFAEEVTRPGFALIRAVSDAHLAGVAYGWTMDAGRWWANGETAPPEDLRAAPKAALMEWFVRRPWRGRGVGAELLRRWLAERTELWAVLASNPAALARQIYAAHGWQQVGISKPDLLPPMDLLALPLQSGQRPESRL